MNAHKPPAAAILVVPLVVALESGEYGAALGRLMAMLDEE